MLKPEYCRKRSIPWRTKIWLYSLHRQVISRHDINGVRQLGQQWKITIIYAISEWRNYRRGQYNFRILSGVFPTISHILAHYCYYTCSGNVKSILNYLMYFMSICPFRSSPWIMITCLKWCLWSCASLERYRRVATFTLNALNCQGYSQVIAHHGIPWGVTTYPCTRYMLLAAESSYMGGFAVACRFFHMSREWHLSRN